MERAVAHGKRKGGKETERKSMRERRQAGVGGGGGGRMH